MGRPTVHCILLLLVATVYSEVIYQGGSCGKDAIPYKVVVDKSGRPEIFCDTPSCIGKGSNPSKPKYEHAVCNKDFMETVCTEENEWTAGLIESNNGTHKTLRTLCCSFERLRDSKELQTVLLNAEAVFEGGIVERNGRVSGFDVIKEIRKTITAENSVQYIASIYRMPCKGEADEEENSFGRQMWPIQLPVEGRHHHRKHRPADEYDYDYEQVPRTNGGRTGSQNTVVGPYDPSVQNKQVSLFPENGVLPPVSGPVQYGANNYEAQAPIPSVGYGDNQAQETSYIEEQFPAPAPPPQEVQQPQQQNEITYQQVEQPQVQGPVGPPQQTSYAAPEGQIPQQPMEQGPSAYPVAPAQQPSYSYPPQECGPTMAAPACVPASYAYPAAAPAYSGGGGGLKCFSGDMEVETPSGNKKMNELKKGDLVLSIDENMIQYSPIVMFLHKLDNETAEFFKLETETGTSIELTGDHLIYTSNCVPGQALNAVRTKDVKVGECFDVIANHGRHVSRQRIVSISKITSKGIYAPLTSTGDIFVNGVLSSCHTNFALKALQQTFFAIYRQASFAYEYLFPVKKVEYEVPFGVEYLSTVMDLFVPKQLF